MRLSFFQIWILSYIPVDFLARFHSVLFFLARFPADFEIFTRNSKSGNSIKGGGNEELIAYTGSDYAGDLVGRRSDLLVLKKQSVVNVFIAAALCVC